MKQLLRKAIHALVVFGLLAGKASGAIIIDISEQSGNVVFEFSGSVNLASTLGKEADRNLTSHFFRGDYGPDSASIQSASGDLDDYNLNLTASPSYGGMGFDGISTGDNFLLESVSHDQIWVPDNYVSGDTISGNLTFLGNTIASLGLIPGNYLWTWENGAFSDSATITVSTVPLSSATWLFIYGLLTVAEVIRRKK